MSPSMGHVGHGNNDIWSLFIALFTRSNAREATKLLASGIAIEGGRRIFKWLADRVVPRAWRPLFSCLLKLLIHALS